jgi:hypothetical protein
MNVEIGWTGRHECKSLGAQIPLDVGVYPFTDNIVVERRVPAIQAGLAEGESSESGEIDGLVGLDLNLLRERAKGQKHAEEEWLHIFESNIHVAWGTSPWSRARARRPQLY